MPPRIPQDDEDNEALALPEDDDVQEGHDAGSDDDGSGDEAGSEGGEKAADEAEEGLEPERPQSRATRAVQAAKQAAREATERAARIEQELQALRNERQQQRQQTEETEEQFNARLQLMTVEERVDAKMARLQTRMTRDAAVAQFRAADMADRASYDAMAASDPRFKRYAGDVENTLAQARAQGNWSLDRRTILAYVIGQKVLGNKETIDRAKAQGQQRVQRQQARTNGGRSDQAPAQRRRFAADDMSLEAIEARLEGRTI